MHVSPLLALLALIFSTTALAEIYKCDAGKNRTVYSDKPCTNNQNQSVVLVPNQSVQSGSTLMLQLGDAVKKAIRNNDLARAEALASTDEQKTWVAEAKKDLAKNTPSKTEAELSAEKANSDDCIAAQKNLEKESKNNYVNQNVLNTKTSIMRVKCGLKQPENMIVNSAPYYSPWPRLVHQQPNVIVGPAYDRHMQNPWQRSNPN